MSINCCVQIMALQRGDPQPHKCKANPKHTTKAKHRANGYRILKEAMEERASLTKRLDRTLSELNTYECVYDLDSFKGEDIWEKMCDEAENSPQISHSKNGKEYTRKIREDCIIGVASIVHLPASVIMQWEDEEEEGGENAKDKLNRFNRDAYEVLSEIAPDIFREENFICSAEHYDEGEPHVHKVYMPKNEEGNFVGSQVTTKNWLQNLNRQFPVLMAKHGWDITPVDDTNFNRMSYDKNYQIEKMNKFSQRAKSANEYAEQKQAEELQKIQNMEGEIEKMYIQSKSELNSAEAKNLAAETLVTTETQKANAEKDKILKVAKEEADKILSDANMDLKNKKKELEDEIEAKQVTLSQIEKDISDKENERDKLDAQIKSKHHISELENDVSDIDIRSKRARQAEKNESEAYNQYPELDK